MKKLTQKTVDKFETVYKIVGRSDSSDYFWTGPDIKSYDKAIRNLNSCRKQYNQPPGVVYGLIKVTAELIEV